MNSFKKVLLALLMIVALAFVFCACEHPGAGSTATPAPTGSTEPEEEVIAKPEDNGVAMKAGDLYRVFVWNNAQENNMVDGTTGTRAAENRQRWIDFQQAYGVTITWVASPNQSAWMDTVLQPAAAGEPYADIYHMGGPFAIPLSLGYGGTAMGSLYENLADYAQYTNFDDNEYWDQSANQAMGFYNGNHYVVFPQSDGWGGVSLNQVTFFNKSIVKAAGYPAEEIYKLYKEGNWTFDKFREVALACTDADRDVWGVSIGENAPAIFSLIASNNGDVLTPNAEGVPEFTADSANSLYAINFFVDMCKTDKSVYMENGYSQVEENLFKIGKVAMMLTYANRAVEGEGPRNGALYQTDGLEYGIVLPPKGPNADDYRTDRNWATPYSVFKGHDNPAGVAQCLSYYLAPMAPMSGPTQAMLLESDAQNYFQDNESIQTLKDAAKKNVTTSYMAYWSITSNNISLGNVLIYSGFNNWVDGSSTPELDYAANKDAVNQIILDTISGS